MKGSLFGVSLFFCWDGGSWRPRSGLTGEGKKGRDGFFVGGTSSVSSGVVGCGCFCPWSGRRAFYGLAMGDLFAGRDGARPSRDLLLWYYLLCCCIRMIVDNVHILELFMFRNSACQPQPRRQTPAHHAPIQRFNESIVIQVNVCTQDRREILACESVHGLCRTVWQEADYWRVGQYVIMPDHIHLFCTPARNPPTSLKQWVEFWKSRIASKWPLSEDGKSHKLWQRDYWDTQMRSRAHYEEKLSYVRLNPVRKDLVASADEWPYQGCLSDIQWL